MRRTLLALAFLAPAAGADAAFLEHEGAGIYRLRDAWTLEPPYRGGGGGVVVPVPVPAPAAAQPPRDDLFERLEAVRRQHGSEPAAPGPAWMPGPRR